VTRRSCGLQKIVLRDVSDVIGLVGPVQVDAQRVVGFWVHPRHEGAGDECSMRRVMPGHELALPIVPQRHTRLRLVSHNPTTVEAVITDMSFGLLSDAFIQRPR
jgi:hypothetical protein